MPKKSELEISISADGEVTIHVQGSKGKSCLDITKELEDALGNVTSREKTSSFYESEETDRVRITEDDR